MAYNIWVETNPKFKPARKNIASITNANPALVTTTTNHEYSTGTIVRLVIPEKKGMQGAHQQTGKIVVVTPTSFTIDIDTTQMDPFVAVDPVGISPLLDVCAQVNPVGESSEMLSAASRDTIS
jgi:hypothetical protein